MLACLASNHDIQHLFGLDAGAMAAIYYCTLYASKLQKHLQSEYAFLLSAHKHRLKVFTDDTPAEKRAQSFLLTLENSIARGTELALTSVTASLAGLPDRYSSHRYVKLVLFPFLFWAEHSDSARNYHHADLPVADDALGDQLRFDLGGGSGDVTASNARLDYVYRPSGLDDMCLYDFCRCFVKQRACTCSIDDTHGSTAAPVWLRFQPEHLQTTSFVLRFLPKDEELVPIILAPPHPDKRTSPELYARMMLLLFKPFRDIAELRPRRLTKSEPITSYVSAWSTFSRTAPAHLLRIAENIDFMKGAEVHTRELRRQQLQDLQTV